MPNICRCPIIATVSAALSSLSLRKCPMRMAGHGCEAVPYAEDGGCLERLAEGWPEPPEMRELRKLSSLAPTRSISVRTLRVPLSDCVTSPRLRRGKHPLNAPHVNQLPR